LAARAGRLAGDRTGIDDKHIGISRVMYNLVTLLLKLPCHPIDFALVEPAAQCT
jgi:hypothetical protein